MTSSAGKAEVHLSVELDDLPPVTLLPPRSSRNGPARQRRREKRAAARQASEKEVPTLVATVEVADEEPDKNEGIAEEAIIGKSDATADVAEEVRTNKDCKELVDEFCPDEEFDLVAIEHDEENAEVFRISFIETSYTTLLNDNDNESYCLYKQLTSSTYLFVKPEIKI